MAFSKNRRLAQIISDTSGNLAVQGLTVPTQSASDNDTSAASTAYVTTAVSGLIDSAPDTLNTLNEIAAALNDDANFNTTVTNSIAAKLPLAGGTMSGALNMGSQNITSVNRISTADGIADTGTAGSATVFNESGSTADFRIESDSDTHMFFLDGGLNRIGIGTSSPSGAKLHVAGGVKATDIIAHDNTGINLQTDEGTKRLVVSDNGAITFNQAYTFPTSDGSASQVLQTDGSGAISFATLSGGPTHKEGGSNFTSSILIGDTGTGTLSSANYNTGLGVDVFSALTSGTANVAIGYHALRLNTTGYNNVAVGASDNTSVGAPLGANTEGRNNVAIGRGALKANTTGKNNVALGDDALGSNTTVDDNTAIGKDALAANTTGHSNTAVGRNAMSATTTATYTTGIGMNAFQNNTTGDGVAVGAFALNANTTGSLNVAVGVNAMRFNTEGDRNTAVGYYALGVNTTGDENVAIGRICLDANTTGHSNVGVGQGALTTNTTGYRNVAVGHDAMLANTTGLENVAIGRGALDANTTTSYNVAVGDHALTSNTASRNTAVGYQAGRDNTSGTKNCFIGYGCGNEVTTGSDNTFMGDNAGTNVTTSSNNTLIGKGAGDEITTSGQNTVVGENASISSGTSQGNEVVVGQGLTGIGYHQGILGGVNGVYNQGNSTSFAQTSDERIKKNIKDYTLGLNTINDIQVRTFEYRELDEIPNGTDGKILNPNELPKGERVGVIAQEIIDVLPSCVKEHSNSRLSVETDNITWTLVKAVQELSSEINELKEEIQTLKGE